MKRGHDELPSNLTVEFAADFDDTVPVDSEVDRAEAEEILRGPERLYRIPFGSAEIVLAARGFSGANFDGQVVVEALCEGARCTVEAAYRVFRCAIDDANPLEALESLFPAFGVPLQVGGERGHFFAERDVALAPNERLQPVTRGMAWVKTEPWEHFHYEVVDTETGPVARCALVYCLNRNPYRHWVHPA